MPSGFEEMDEGVGLRLGAAYGRGEGSRRLPSQFGGVRWGVGGEDGECIGTSRHSKGEAKQVNA